MKRFASKVAIVTGAASGIGAATAQALAAEGACVAAFDLDRGGLSATVSAIAAAGGEATAITGDTRREEEVARAVEATVQAYGGVDLLAAIAGVMGFAPIAELDAERWDFVLDTNVKGPFLFVRSALPHMRRRGGGAIVTASSMMAAMGAASTTAYAASKGAVLSLTHALAVELAADGVRVNTIAPGTVRTGMLEGMSTEDENLILSSNPIGRLIEPAEVARLVLFLLSEEASAITGSCHPIDGGLPSNIRL